MTDTQTLADGKVGIIHYTLRDDAGEVIDSSRDGDPMPYLHGASNIVPGLEQALAGKGAGESFEVTVSPAEGYGEPSGEAPQAVPRAQLPAQVAVGQQLVMQTPQGQKFPVWVTAVTADEALLTTDHPLAGKNLNFEVEVVGVRDATADELAHGHTHGIDGKASHGHGGGGGGKRSLARKDRKRKRR